MRKNMTVKQMILWLKAPSITIRAWRHCQNIFHKGLFTVWMIEWQRRLSSSPRLCLGLLIKHVTLGGRGPECNWATNWNQIEGEVDGIHNVKSKQPGLRINGHDKNLENSQLYHLLCQGKYRLLWWRSIGGNGPKGCHHIHMVDKGTFSNKPLCNFLLVLFIKVNKVFNVTGDNKVTTFDKFT